MHKITLNYPLVINGQDIRVIEYDPADFKTKDLLLAASSRKYSSLDSTPNPVNDTELHFNIAVRAVLASNRDKGWTAEDFRQLTGSDPLLFSIVGMSFFGVKPGEQQPGSSAGQSESIAADIMSAGENC